MSIQVGLNKVKTLFSPSAEYNEDNKKLSDYNWKLSNDKAEAINFQNFKGEVVFINLWATWCAPCVAEMPVMNDLYSDYKDQVQFLFVSNESIEKVRAFKSKKNLELATYQPNSLSPVDLRSKTIPATFIIGKDGTIHVAERGVANWNSNKVRDLLDRLISE